MLLCPLFPVGVLTTRGPVNHSYTWLPKVPWLHRSKSVISDKSETELVRELTFLQPRGQWLSWPVPSSSSDTPGGCCGGQRQYSVHGHKVINRASSARRTASHASIVGPYFYYTVYFRRVATTDDRGVFAAPTELKSVKTSQSSWTH